MKAFIISHLKFCPVVWMLYAQDLNYKISRINERSFRIVYGDNTSSFDELLRKDKSVKYITKTCKFLVQKSTRSNTDHGLR